MANVFKAALKQGTTTFILDLQVLLLLLVTSAHSGAIRGTVLTCHPRDRDPCANFPELCSAGNGLCVVKVNNRNPLFVLSWVDNINPFSLLCLKRKGISDATFKVILCRPHKLLLPFAAY